MAGCWPAAQLGLTEVPTLCLDHLTPAQARAFMIADNRLTEIATWDDRLLAQQLKDLSLLGLDFSLEVTGFEMGEIDLRIASLEDAARAGRRSRPISCPNRSAGPPVSRIGDLWLLGRHRVLCGNALDRRRLRGADGRGTRRDGVHRPALQRPDRWPCQRPRRDPPSPLPDGLGRDGQSRVHRLSRARLAATSPPSAPTARSISSAWIGAISKSCWPPAESVYGELKNLCVWVKDNGGMGSLYRSQHELVFVFKHGRDGHRNNVQLGRFGRNRSNVWHYPGANSFARCGEEGNLLALHPTVKPVAMVADAILDCSARGDIVLDAFLGSGTTVIAAERTGRRCYGLGARPGLCRHDHPPLAGADRRQRPSCRERPQL